MKTLFSPLFLAVVLAFSTASSCSPKKVVYVTVDTAVSSIDQLMSAYAQQVAAGNVSVDQERQVKAAWEKYQKANLATEAALRMWLAADAEDEPGLKAKAEAAGKALKAMEDELKGLLKGLL